MFQGAIKPHSSFQLNYTTGVNFINIFPLAFFCKYIGTKNSKPITQFCYFWRQNFVRKLVRKTLMKLTPGLSLTGLLLTYIIVLLQFNLNECGSSSESKNATELLSQKPNISQWNVGT